MYVSISFTDFTMKYDERFAMALMKPGITRCNVLQRNFEIEQQRNSKIEEFLAKLAFKPQQFDTRMPKLAFLQTEQVPGPAWAKSAFVREERKMKEAAKERKRERDRLIRRKVMKMERVPKRAVASKQGNSKADKLPEGRRGLFTGKMSLPPLPERKYNPIKVRHAEIWKKAKKRGFSQIKSAWFSGKLRPRKCKW